MNPFDLTGTTALVSGSSRGIGLALAKGLLQAGSRVTIHGRNIDQVKTTALDLAEETGGETPIRMPSTAESPTSSSSGERLTSWSTTPASSAVPRSLSSRCRTGMTSLPPT